MSFVESGIFILCVFFLYFFFNYSWHNSILLCHLGQNSCSLYILKSRTSSLIFYITKDPCLQPWWAHLLWCRSEQLPPADLGSLFRGVWHSGCSKALGLFLCPGLCWCKREVPTCVMWQEWWNEASSVGVYLPSSPGSCSWLNLPFEIYTFRIREFSSSKCNTHIGYNGNSQLLTL